MKKIVTITLVLLMINTNKSIGQSDSLITNLSIDHIINYPDSFNKNDTIKRYPLLFSLHGHGSNEQDLIGLATHLNKEIFWVSGRGPHTLRPNSFDWYQLPPTPQKIGEILNNLNIFIDELIKEYPIDTNHIYLMGFSQGSMISLSYIMAFPEKIAGVIAQSGAIPHDIGLEVDSEGLQGKPIIITHGTQDNAMPITRGYETRDQLVELGANVEFYEFEMGHSINNESLSVVDLWLNNQIKNKK